MDKNNKKKQKNKKKMITPNIKIANLVLGITFIIMMILVIRAGVLSLSTEVDGKNLKDFAASRTTEHETILAKRGTIYDVNGDILAQNVYSYTLIAYLAESRGEGNYVKDKEMTAEKLSTVIDMSKEEILALLNRKT